VVQIQYRTMPKMPPDWNLFLTYLVLSWSWHRQKHLELTHPTNYVLAIYKWQRTNPSHHPDWMSQQLVGQEKPFHQH
jgi:hypothetical protein